MNPGDRNNASGHGANAGSNSGRSVVTPALAGAGARNNRNSGSSSHSKRDEDDGYNLPATNVVRIMRGALPDHAKISDAAKEAVQECVSEYISLITSEANERCLREHRKTLTPEDLLYAMAKLGFDDYIQPLTLYLNRYRESESQRTSVNGEPTVFRAVNSQHLLGPHHHQAPASTRAPPPSPARPPIPTPPMYINPTQVAPPPPRQPIYVVNPAEMMMRGFQGYYHVAPPPLPGSTPDIAGPSTSVAYVPPGSAGVYPYNAAYPQPSPPNDYPTGRQFFK